MSAFNWVPEQEADVYTIDGHLVGRVVEAWPAEYAGSRTLARTVGKLGAGFFRMTGFKKGWRAQPIDLYVPLDAMSDYADGRIRLRFTKNQLAKQGFDQRPAGLPAAAEEGRVVDLPARS